MLFLLFFTSVTLGASESIYEKGVIAYQSGGYERAFKLFTDATNQGVTQDYKQAVKWYTLAAEQGDTDAHFNLGVMYERGEGVIQDYKQAVK